MNTAPPIGSRSRLVQQLHVATELEHSLCCQYLYAVFSLRRTSADYPEHLDRERVELMMNATGRWATDIFAVAREEMEHLAIATNMLSAINEPPHLTHHDYPDQGLEPILGAPLVLERCNLDTLRRFQFFERPKGLEGAKTPAVEAIYLEIKSLFQTLQPASELFTGDGLRQLDPTDFELGVSMKVLPVTSRATAVQAVALILEQGEGLGELATATDSHFARYTATIQDYEQVVNSLKIEPSLPVVTNPVSHPAADGRVPAGATLVTNQFSAALMDLFNEGYRLMLVMLRQFLWGFRGYSGMFEAVEAIKTPKQIAAERLVTMLGENAYFPMMTMFIRPIGELLARQPAFADVGDPARAGASFQTGDSIPAWTEVRPYVDALDALATQAQRLATDAPNRTVANALTYLYQNLSRMRMNILNVSNHGR
jgi:Ferritin-like